jgi:hypothetical protein
VPGGSPGTTARRRLANGSSPGLAIASRPRRGAVSLVFSLVLLGAIRLLRAT